MIGNDNMSDALTEHEDIISKMKVELVKAIMKEEADTSALKEARRKIIDGILISLPSLLKDNRYDDTININVRMHGNKLNNQEYNLFSQELDNVLRDLKLDPQNGVAGTNYITISKMRLVNLVDAKKLASLI